MEKNTRDSLLIEELITDKEMKMLEVLLLQVILYQTVQILFAFPRIVLNDWEKTKSKFPELPVGGSFQILHPRMEIDNSRQYGPVNTQRAVQNIIYSKTTISQGEKDISFPCFIKRFVKDLLEKKL